MGILSLLQTNTFMLLTLRTNQTLIRQAKYYGHIKYACVTNRAIVIICQNGICYSSIPTNLEVKLKSISFKPDKIAFTDSGNCLITNENEAYSYNI